MKYLIIYVILIFVIYIYLKYYCYIDQINILNKNQNSTLDSKSSLLNDSVSIEEFSPLTSLYVQKKPEIYSSLLIEKNLYDDYDYLYQFTETTSKNIKENFEGPSSKILNNSNQIKWKSFGTDISSDYVKQKKLQFREITSPNISIEKYNVDNSNNILNEYLR
jgi:hypothetical protein